MEGVKLVTEGMLLTLNLIEISSDMVAYLPLER